MESDIQRRKIAGYWTFLSSGLGALVLMLGFTPPLPLWVTVSSSTALLAAGTLLSVRLGQISRRVWTDLPTASVGFASWLVVPFAAAILLRDTPVALWAVPLLATATTVASNVYLARSGPFLMPDGTVVRGLPPATL